MIWDIFYNPSDKTIAWTANGGVTEGIISSQQAASGHSHIQVEQDDLVDANKYIVNEDENGILLKSSFEPSFSTIIPNLEGTVNITGLPVGTKVYIDDVLKSTMTDTSLNITFNDPGNFRVTFRKSDHLEYEQLIVVGRYV